MAQRGLRILLLSACAIHASAAAIGGLPVSVNQRKLLFSSKEAVMGWRLDHDAEQTSMRLRGGLTAYKDLISHDEMMSDSFPIEIVDDVMLKVTTKFVVKDAIDVNVGGGGEFGGAGEDEKVEDHAEKVNDVVDAFQLKTLGSMDKKGVLAWVKGYLKAIKERLDKENPERSAVFQEKSQKWVKEVLLKNPTDFEFYSGASYNTDAGLAMFVYEGENVAPHCYLFKDGLLEEKC